MLALALMVQVESQVFVRVNSHNVRVLSPSVRAVSQQCKSSVLCGVPQHPMLYSIVRIFNRDGILYEWITGVRKV